MDDVICLSDSDPKEDESSVACDWGNDISDQSYKPLSSLNGKNSMQSSEATEKSTIFQSSLSDEKAFQDQNFSQSRHHQPTRLKKTARKAISSFEPRIKRRIVPEVVNVEDDDDDDDVLSEVDAPFNVQLTMCNVKNAPQPESVSKRELSGEEIVSEAVDHFLSETRSLMSRASVITDSDFDRIEQRFTKKVSRLSHCDTRILRDLAGFIRNKATEISDSNLFSVVKEIFWQIDIHKKGKKPENETLNDDHHDTKMNQLNGAAKTSAAAATEEKPTLDSAATSASSTLPKTREVSSLVTAPNELKRRRNIKKLEKALVACHSSIKRLETSELDMDALDDDESDYLKLDRFRQKFMKIYRKIAELRNQDPSLNRRMDKKIKLGDVSRYEEVNIRLQRFVNKKCKRKIKNGEKMSKFCFFPDFSDVFQIFVAFNSDQNRGIRQEQLHDEARSTFKFVVEKLKGLREEDDIDDLMSYLPETEAEDPAEKDGELASTLRQNRVEGEQKMSKLMEDFVTQIEPPLTECDDVNEETTDEEDVSDEAS